jgi:hypothetical protein
VERGVAVNAMSQIGADFVVILDDGHLNGRRCLSVLTVHDAIVTLR